MTMPEEIKDEAAIDLIEQMLKRDPKERIDVHEVPMHPYFWSETKCLDFIQDTCRTIEPEFQNTGALYQPLEEGKEAVFQGEWTVNLTDEVRADLFRRRMVNNETTRTSLYFLLKAIRNKVVACLSIIQPSFSNFVFIQREHFDELSKEVKEEFGQPPEGYFHYWASRFPRLLMYTWKIMKSAKDHRNMEDYYI
jgi:serine/threonine protein kinase